MADAKKKQEKGGRVTGGGKTSPAAETRARERVKEIQAERKADRRVIDEIWAIISIAVGVFLIIATLTNGAGAFGKVVGDGLKGVFGFIAYVLPFYLIVYGILLFARKAAHISLKSGLLLLLTLLMLTMMNSIRFINPTTLDLSWDAIKGFYSSGVTLKSGGFLGMLLSSLLIKWLGKAGCWIFTIAVTVAALLLLVNTPVSRFFARMGEKIEERRLLREQRLEEMAREEEEAKATLRQEMETQPPAKRSRKQGKVFNSSVLEEGDPAKGGSGAAGASGSSGASGATGVSGATGAAALPAGSGGATAAQANPGAAGDAARTAADGAAQTAEAAGKKRGLAGANRQTGPSIVRISGPGLDEAAAGSDVNANADAERAETAQATQGQGAENARTGYGLPADDPYSQAQGGARAGEAADGSADADAVGVHTPPYIPLSQRQAMEQSEKKDSVLRYMQDDTLFDRPPEDSIGLEERRTYGAGYGLDGGPAPADDGMGIPSSPSASAAHGAGVSSFDAAGLSGFGAGLAENAAGPEGQGTGVHGSGAAPIGDATQAGGASLPAGSAGDGAPVSANRFIDRSGAAIVPGAVKTPGASNPAGPGNAAGSPAASVQTGAAMPAAPVPAPPPVYRMPPVDLLTPATGRSATDAEALRKKAEKLEETLRNFHVDASVVQVTQGPAVTRYEIQPAVGVKVSSIVRLADDIALNLEARSIRIEAPIPGKPAVGIEVENDQVTMVRLREIIESSAFRGAKSKITFAVGKDIGGNAIVGNLKSMPHLLIAGSTGSGKSVCINSIILSLLYKARPEEVKLILIDPKVVELGNYNGIPHLLIPVVTDPSKAAAALNWAVTEMTDRYKKFAEAGVRDLEAYNEAARADEEEDRVMPQVVIIIDELADLMMAAPSQIEESICRLAQMARAAGMHLIVATQRPSVDVITGVIKANIPSRIAFAVSSQVDSRTILDMQGAEKLVGKGDMLYYPMGMSKPLRVQGTFVSDSEVNAVIDFVRQQTAPVAQGYSQEILSQMDKTGEDGDDDSDDLLPEAIELVVKSGQASVSMLQRRFRIGYNRAARIVDMMESRGVVGPQDGSRPRQVLLSEEAWEKMKEEGL